MRIATAFVTGVALLFIQGCATDTESSQFIDQASKASNCDNPLASFNEKETCIPKRNPLVDPFEKQIEHQ